MSAQVEFSSTGYSVVYEGPARFYHSPTKSYRTTDRIHEVEFTDNGETRHTYSCATDGCAYERPRYIEVMGHLGRAHENRPKGQPYKKNALRGEIVLLVEKEVQRRLQEVLDGAVTKQSRALKTENERLKVLVREERAKARAAEGKLEALRSALLK